MATLKELRNKYKSYRNTLVIDMDYKIKLFSKIGSDEDDYYYELFEIEETEPSLSSCVGFIIPLIDKLNKEDYGLLVQVWNLNSPRKAR